MTETFVIPVPSLLLYLSILLLPILIFRHLRLHLNMQLVLAVVRMAVQLVLVGVYLEYIFRLDSMWMNLGWIAIMIIVASSSILRQSGLDWKVGMLPTLLALGMTCVVMLAGFLLVFDRHTLGSAQYMVPLMGMVLGNILRSNVVVLDRFFAELRAGEDVYIQYLTLGATLSEATRPFLRNAYRAAVGPQLATMATMGIVSLPGMMTGQILGGSSPLLAITYQIMIMVAIFTATTISVFLAVCFVRGIAFDEYGKINPRVFIG